MQKEECNKKETYLCGIENRSIKLGEGSHGGEDDSAWNATQMRCLGRIRHHAQGSHSTPPHRYFPPAPSQNTNTTPPHPRHHLSPSSETADLLSTTTHHMPTVPTLQFRSPSPSLPQKLQTTHALPPEDYTSWSGYQFHPCIPGVMFMQYFSFNKIFLVTLKCNN